jgi:signal transduction histidine kinase
MPASRRAVATTTCGIQDLVEQVIAAAAHEFKTPLAVVRAEAQLLERRGGADVHLANITRQVDRLTHLVQQVLEVSRLRFGPPTLSLEVIDLCPVVADVVRRVERAAPIHQFRLALSGEPIFVRVDCLRIEHALVNLIDNAVRFSPDGGVVDVSVRAGDGAARVSVRDEGIGIPTHRQERIFELLYRAHAGLPDDYGGIGIGLAIVRHITACHGGTVFFESDAGVGSTFTLSLPLAQGR